jgi:hypothetical protein
MSVLCMMYFYNTWYEYYVYDVSKTCYVYDVS